MALVQINWKPEEKTLVQFSELWMFFLGMVMAPLSYYQGNTKTAVVFWCLAVLGRLVGMIKPSWIKPLFLGLSILTFPIGFVVSHVVLFLVFALVFTPVGLWFRIMGRDSLHRRFDPDAKSYWEAYNPDRGRARYLRQF